MVKNLPAMQKTRVQSLGWEDPLEKGMVPHSSILAWEIPRREEPGGLQSIASQRQIPLSDRALTGTDTPRGQRVCVCVGGRGAGRLVVGRLILGKEQKFHPIHT